MLWLDFLVDRQFDDLELTATLAAILPVERSRIRVIHDSAEAPGVSDQSVQILCDAVGVDGDFVMGIQLYVLDGELERWVADQDDRVVIGRFCEIGRCSALVDDGSVNPYAWYLIRDTTDITHVLLDSRRLDRDEYVVVADIPADAMASD